jgi:hypothetical protein
LIVLFCNAPTFSCSCLSMGFSLSPLMWLYKKDQLTTLPQRGGSPWSIANKMFFTEAPRNKKRKKTKTT